MFNITLIYINIIFIIYMVYSSVKFGRIGFSLEVVFVCGVWRYLDITHEEVKNCFLCSSKLKSLKWFRSLIQILKKQKYIFVGFD